ncbi:MAG: hypothetical protein ACKOQ8_05585 [Micrococcales bacterium]
MSEEEDLLRISNAEMMGRIAERERILKLAEKELKRATRDYPRTPQSERDLGREFGYRRGIAALIALIKGENK